MEGYKDDEGEEFEVKRKEKKRPQHICKPSSCMDLPSTSKKGFPQPTCKPGAWSVRDTGRCEPKNTYPSHDTRADLSPASTKR